MNTATLPDGYEVLETIDLQTNKKLALGVNLAAFAVAAVLFVLGCFFVPLSVFIPFDAGAQAGSSASLMPLFVMLIKLVSFLAGIILYMILHEVIHGIFMKLYGRLKPYFGLTPLYAYCGSDAYFDRKSYLVIGLSPVVIWGIVLLAAMLLVPVEWFWVVYVIQILNLAGAAGDIYVTYRMLRLAPDILVKDSGVSMIIYAPPIQK